MDEIGDFGGTKNDILDNIFLTSLVMWFELTAAYFVHLQNFMVIIPLIVYVTGFCVSLLMRYACDKLGRKVLWLLCFFVLFGLVLKKRRL